MMDKVRNRSDSGEYILLITVPHLNYPLSLKMEAIFYTEAFGCEDY
jgi:hypothetical protein